MTTHWVGCWKEHEGCAAEDQWDLLTHELQEAMGRVIVVERDHSELGRKHQTTLLQLADSQRDMRAKEKECEELKATIARIVEFCREGDYVGGAELRRLIEVPGELE